VESLSTLKECLPASTRVFPGPVHRAVIGTFVWLHHCQNASRFYDCPEKRMNWIDGVLIGIDQLGNAIVGGNHDATISARTGYFANININRDLIYY